MRLMWMHSSGTFILAAAGLGLSVGGAAAWDSAAGDFPPPPPPSAIHSVASPQLETIAYLGSRKGFVAKTLSAARPAALGPDYDILVVGDADKLGTKSVLRAVESALARSKAVVFDAASDGSGRLTHGDVLWNLVGTRIDAQAVRVTKADGGRKGYYVTPIDPPKTVAAGVAATDQKGVSPQPQNTVASVFGLVSNVAPAGVSK